MTTGILFNHDDAVAVAVFNYYGSPPLKYDKCLGIVKGEILVGGIFFTNWNGFNVELGYYGEKTLTLGVVRMIARYSIATFDPSRLSITTSKRNRQLIAALLRMGFKLEGIQRCYYGKEDTRRNTGVKLVMFRDRLEQIAKYPKNSSEVA